MKQYEKYILPVAIVLGVIGGFLYWKFVGCTGGSCPIFSQWHLTSIYGGAVGYLVGDFIRGFLKKKKQNEQVSGDNK